MNSCINYSAYKTIKTLKEIDDVGLVTTYGIKVTDPADNVSYICEDISCDEDFVNSLAENLTQCGVSPIQMKEIISDCLC